MGKIFKTGKVKLITSIIYRESGKLLEAEKALRGIFGETESLEFAAPFDYTDYYESEFGSPLKRKVIVFKGVIPEEKAHLTKVSTNAIENIMSVDKRRVVNIDPGYITEAKLALFTTKDYSHRIYVGDGIFAECTLFFRSGVYNPWPWTYPDYGSGLMCDFFGRVRDLYVKDLGVARGL